MLDAISRCEAPATDRRAVRLQRSDGEVRLAFKRRGRRSVLARLYQRGAAKVRLPQTERADAPEAVLINTAGGVAGGDRFAFDVALAEGAAALVTTQAAERIYRSLGDTADIRNRLRIAARAHLEWLPQETILFDQARLTRRLDIDMAADAEVIVLEAIVLGRTAMGEYVRSGTIIDRWRLRRGGRLVFADALRLAGAIDATLAGRATARGAKALATVVCATPRAADVLGAARAALATARHPAGASSWNDLVVMRLAAPDGQSLRRTLERLLIAIRGGAKLPRVWQC